VARPGRSDCPHRQELSKETLRHLLEGHVVASLYFVTPVYKRFELTKICLEQHLWVCEELAKHGINATNVVIGNDANLKVAKQLGFPTIRQNNEWLSRKFNDGYEAAGKAKADYVYPVGSDSFIDYKQFLNLGADHPVASRYYAMVHSSGERLIDVWINVPGGIGPLVTPVSLYAKAGYRPIQNDLNRGCDNGARKWLLTQGYEISFNDIHQYEHIGFQSGNTQITNFDRLRRVYRAKEHSIKNGVWKKLEEIYPVRSTEQIKEYYASGRSLKA
jgi:hypothetical protein